MSACFGLALAWDDADHPFRIFVGDVGKALVNAGVEIARFHLETVAQFFRLLRLLNILSWGRSMKTVASMGQPSIAFAFMFFTTSVPSPRPAP